MLGPVFFHFNNLYVLLSSVFIKHISQSNITNPNLNYQNIVLAEARIAIEYLNKSAAALFERPPEILPFYVWP